MDQIRSRIGVFLQGMPSGLEGLIDSLGASQVLTQIGVVSSSNSIIDGSLVDALDLAQLALKRHKIDLPTEFGGNILLAFWNQMRIGDKNMRWSISLYISELLE